MPNSSSSAGISCDNICSKSVATFPNTEGTPTSIDTVMKSEVGAVMSPSIETNHLGKDNRKPMLNIPVNVVEEYIANDKAKENGVSTNGMDSKKVTIQSLLDNEKNLQSLDGQTNEKVHSPPVEAVKSTESMEVLNGNENRVASSLVFSTIADTIDSVINGPIKPLSPVTNTSSSYVPASDLIELQTLTKSSNTEDKTVVQDIGINFTNSSCKRPLSESSEDNIEKKKIKTFDTSPNPLVMNEVVKLKEASSKLKRMKRKDLEKIVLSLFMEKFVHNHELGKYKELSESLESTLESNKKKCARFCKEVNYFMYKIYIL